MKLFNFQLSYDFRIFLDFSLTYTIILLGRFNLWKVGLFMNDNVIYVDFSKNRMKRNETLLSFIKRMLRQILSSPNPPTNPDNDRKVIYYKKGIS